MAVCFVINQMNAETYMMNECLLTPKFSFAIEGLEEFMLSKQWMIKRLFVSSGVYTKYPVGEMHSCFLLQFTVMFFVLQFLKHYSS